MTSEAGAGVVRVFKALADPTRLRIFEALRAKERCVRDLVEGEGLPQPLVSHHLAVLTDAGLVTARRQEGFTMYAVDPAGVAGAAGAVAGVLDSGSLGPEALPGGNLDCCGRGGG